MAGITQKIEPTFTPERETVRDTARKTVAKDAEALGFVVIDRADLEAHYAEIRELDAGGAAVAAIAFAFEALGEPGTEDN